MGASRLAIPGKALSQGTVSVTSSTTVNYTSTSAVEVWPIGYWDQSHQQGTINFAASSLGGSYVQFWSARIVTCSALTAAGTASFTIDNPLPNNNYNSATITGLSTGPSVVWTPSIRSLTIGALATSCQPEHLPPGVRKRVPAPGRPCCPPPWGSSSGTMAATSPLAYTFNTTTGKIRFIAPTYVIANNAEPPDVWIYQPITTNNLYAVYPGDTIGPPQTPNYSGTSNSVDGLRKTLTVTIDQWTDPVSLGPMGRQAVVCSYTRTTYGLVFQTPLLKGKWSTMVSTLHRLWFLETLWLLLGWTPIRTVSPARPTQRDGKV